MSIIRTGHKTPRDFLNPKKTSRDQSEVNSPLGSFFHEILDVPFDVWTEWELSRALRQEVFQNLFAEELVHYALILLKSQPLAGGYYYADLLESFTYIPSDYWAQHSDQKRLVVERAKAALLDPDIDEVAEKEIKMLSLMASGTIPRGNS